MKLGATILLCVALAAVSGAVHAADDETFGGLRQLSYSLSAGAILPGGQEGEGLDPGVHAGALIHLESGSGLSLGGEAQWNRSTDPLRTSIFALGPIARISPRDYSAAYMRLGLGGYFVAYNPKSPSTPRPESLIRPGGSFGAGFEAFQIGKMSIGAAAVYHGILIEGSDALSFVTVAIAMTWRPYSF